MNYKRCSYCGTQKRITDFNSNGWCKECMRQYLKMYKSPRLDFSETMLTEKEMEVEMESIKQIDPRGLNALVDFSKQFEKTARSIKSFSSKTAKRTSNPKSKKAILYNQTNFNN